MDPSQITEWPRAEQWSLLAGNLGKWSIYGGIALFVIAVVLAIIGDSKPLAKARDIAFFAGSGCLFLAFGVLGTLFLKDQFQFEYVASHSEKVVELKYKVAAIWSGQQGSFLLWASTSAMFGLLAFRGTGIYRRWFVVAISSFLACICGILAYETPFNLIRDVVIDGVTHVPPTGNGMEPSLLNYWVVIHPPTIFTGFGSLIVMFAYGVSAMLTGNVVDYIPRVRPWALGSMAVLGLGIVMGGLWAYETQGWGGFWAWDPVENVSFVPWLFVVTLLHGLIVQTTRSRWVLANLVMAGVPFLTFVYGTFLTRSGLLTDVSNHSFASMDKSASKILVWFLAIVVVAFTALVIARGIRLAKSVEVGSQEESGVSRESLYKFGTLMVSLLAVVIALGMSWPVISALVGSRMTKVEEGLYHKVVGWFFVPTMLLIGAAPFATWRDMGLKALFTRLTNILAVSIGLTGFGIFAIKSTGIANIMKPGETIPVVGLNIPVVPWIMFLVFLCIFATIGNLVRIGEMVRRTKTGLGGFIAHVGIAVLLGGLILSRGLEQKQEVMVQDGVPRQALDYTVTYKGLSTDNTEDRENKALFDVTTAGGETIKARPGLYYHVSDNKLKAVVWPYIHHEWSHDIYMALFPPVMGAWEDPVMFAPGEEKTISDFKVKNLGMRMVGQPGLEGTRFVSDVEVTYVGKNPDPPEAPIPYKDVLTKVAPELVIGSPGNAPTPSMASINKDFMITMTRIDAATKSVELQILLKKPIFPVVLYYKPMTLLVWIGAGILTIGGLLAALGRWFKPRGPMGAPIKDQPIDEVVIASEPIQENAPVPVA